MANKEIRVSSAGGGGDGVSALPLRDLVFEVLTRLPAKSLMRFKCVSKFWCSIIGDPLFSKAHRSASGLLIICPERYNLYFLSAAIPPASAQGEESTTPGLLTSDFKLRLRVPVICDGVTQVINGLLCFYVGNRAILWNISTLEMMELPFSNIRSFPTSTYYFGFHSSTNEYKLLKVCSTFHFSNNSRCEILTLGKDASWRSIDAPPHMLCTPSVCVNGALFWLHPSSNGYSISVFDLKEENFQVILPPRTFPRYNLLLQFRGHLAVAGHQFRQSLDLWVLESYEGQSESWTKHLIDLPFDLADKGYWFPAGNLSTGEMLLIGGVIKSFIPVYSYNHAKDQFEELVIGGFGPSPSILGKILGKGSDVFQIYYYEENIVPFSEFELSRAGADFQWGQPGIEKILGCS